jgi:hypothetical protein
MGTHGPGDALCVGQPLGLGLVLVSMTAYSSERPSYSNGVQVTEAVVLTTRSMNPTPKGDKLAAGAHVFFDAYTPRP